MIPPAQANNRGLLALLAFGNFIIGMGAFVVIGIVSPIADGLGASTASAGMVLTTYACAYALLSPIGAAVTGNLSRRAVLVSPRYLHQYAAHSAWLEDHRRMDNGAICHKVLGLALTHPVSRNWKGYWQRGK